MSCASQTKIIRAWYQPSLSSSLSEPDRNRFLEWDRQISLFPQQKKPWVAGSLSAVVPGLGQVYNGNYQSAAFSFVLSALFLSATLELQRKDLHSTALASGVLFSVVYVGNIVGSVQSSKALNLKAQQPSRNELRQRLFPELSF